MTTQYLTARQVCERFAISDMSLWRWLNNPAMDFPQPMVINRRRLFSEQEIVEFEVRQRNKTAVAA